MNIQTHEGQKHWCVKIFSVLATLFFVYMAVCDIAGISGKIAFFQREFFCVSRYFGVIVYSYWFIHGTISGMLSVLCFYAAYRMKAAKKRYGTLVLCLLIPYFLNLYFKPGSGKLWGMTIFMAVIVGGLFAMANVPSMIARAILNRILLQPSDVEDTTEFAKQQLRRIEWIRFFPLKKVLIGGLWFSGFALGLLCISGFLNRMDLVLLLIGWVLLSVAGCMARTVWRYIKMPYHCVPILNKVLSKEQIQSLLQGERFERIPFENKNLQKYAPILLSENWAIIEGMLVSRKLMLRGDVYSGIIDRVGSRIQITYLSGERFETRMTDLYLSGEYEKEVQDSMYCISKIHFPMIAIEKIAKQYADVLPEIQNPQEKVWYLITHDISQIKEGYQAVLAPKRNPRKKERRKNGKNQPINED